MLGPRCVVWGNLSPPRRPPSLPPPTTNKQKLILISLEPINLEKPTGPIGACNRQLDPNHKNQWGEL